MKKKDISFQKERRYWRKLKKSQIFNWWYMKFFTELLYDLEILDLERDEICKKYKKKFYKYLQQTYKMFNYINKSK